MNLHDLSGKRVAVAMSGGVDSSVAALLCVRAGAQAVGLSMQLSDRSEELPGGAGARSCCAPDDLYDARVVAAQLGIPHYVLNQEKVFAREVVHVFVDEYRRGRTPNPCALCNEKVKFAPLVRRARQIGAAALVTGHYARRVNGASGPELRRAQDLGRDQSYFLFGVDRAALSYTRFPLGNRTKAEVRSLAREAGLKVADKPDSMEVCFVGAGPAADFVAVHGGAGEPGAIVDRSGRIVGRHGGVHRFTVGQRRGLGLYAPQARYVVSLSAERAEVVVGDEEDLWADGCLVEGVRWLSKPPRRARVQIRHRGTPAPASLTGNGDSWSVRFDVRVRAVAPGQAAVFYSGDRVLGGGWIARSWRSEPARRTFEGSCTA